MSLLGGGSKSSIPSMSWDSVLDKRPASSRRSSRGSANDPGDGAHDPGGDEREEAPTSETDDASSVDAAAEVASPSEGAASDGAASEVAPVEAVAAPAPIAGSDTPSGPSTPDVTKAFAYEPEQSSISFETTPLRLGGDEPVEDVAPRSTTPPPPPPPPGAATPPPPAAPPLSASAPQPATAMATAGAVAVADTDGAVEATVESDAAASSSTDAPDAVDASAATDVVAPSPADPVAPPAPPVTEPNVPSGSPLTLPDAPAKASPSTATPNPSVTATPYSALVAEAAASTHSKQRKRKRSGGGFGVLVLLIVLAALVAAGIIYGRPYLFPEEWDESSRDYAENIEEIRGVAYTEPLIVVEEPTADYRARVGNQLLGDWESQEPMWRALGLASGGGDREVLDELIVDRSQAIYYEADGQVYHDASLPTVDKDPHVYRAMAEAAIDQQYRLTPTAGSRSLLAEAMTDAHVLQQARAIQESSEAPTAIRPTNDTALAFLPPVLDYQLWAPTVFAELLPEYSDVVTNALEAAATTGAGPLYERELELAPGPDLPSGETAVGTAEPMSPSFWFLVFGSHVSPREAWDLSMGLDSASLLEVSAGGDDCWYSSFTAPSGGTPAMVPTLESWVAAAAPELQASVALDGDVLRMRTCDPGDDFTSNARFAVGRDLVAFQATELAALVGVAEAGGDAATVEAAVAAVNRQGAAGPVLDLDPSASAREMSAAAVGAVETIVDPSSAPAEGDAATEGDAVDAEAGG